MTCIRLDPSWQPSRAGAGAGAGVGACACAWAFTLAFAAAASTGFAAVGVQNLADPTRPPAGMYRPAPAAAGAQTSANANAAPPPAAASAASAASPPVARTMRLQGIRHNGASGGGVAMIDGELIELGGPVAGGWTLSAMSSDDVLLTGPAGQRRLTLLGDDTATDKPRAAKGRRTRKE